MSIGTSNRTQVSIIKETIPGTTPATPVMKIMRMTGESLKSTNTTAVSEEIRSDRSTSDLILVDQSNGGDLMGEISGSTYDQLMEGALFSDSTWTTPQVAAATTIASTAVGFTDSANGFISSSKLQAGQFFKVSGMANPLNNTIYRALTVTAGVVTTDPVPAAVATSGASVFLKGSTIKNGITDHAFSIQKIFKDTTVPSYLNLRGARVSTMKLDFATGAIGKITFGFMAQTGQTTEAQISGLTELPATTTDVMNCVSNVTKIVAISDDIETPLYFTDLSFTYDNKLRELKAIGNLGSIGIRPGTIEAKATLNPYLENIELLEAFLANASFAIYLQMESSDGYGYVFSLPKVKFLSQEVTAAAKDQDLIIKGEVQALIDPVSGCTMRIDRFF